jgi:hypothetical protein
VMSNELNPLPELKKRFAYQFEGDHLDISVAKGWVPLFTKLCEDIDSTLGEDKKGFHYRQVKEKFGTGRFYWQLGKKARPLRIDLIMPTQMVSFKSNRGSRAGKNAELMHALTTLEMAVEQRTREICIICGAEPAKIDSHGGYMLNLCEQHSEQRRAGKLESPWYQE